MALELLARLRGGGSAPARPALREILLAGLGGVIAIALVAWLTVEAGVPLLMAPLGASCFLVFTLPGSPLAQPRHLIGGHLLSSLVGLLVLLLCGEAWWSYGLAVGLAIVVMQLTRTGHPPAGADPLVVMALQPDWTFLITPVLLGTLAVTLVAVLFNNLSARSSYPSYWLG